jgi:D-alanyl-D-alanine carboxypeptidase/D-alanyl-D-alanine-endopeptidase (penicillin-binding protein 4)
LPTRFRKLPKIVVLICLFASVLSPVGWADSLEKIQTKIAQYLKRPGVRSAEWGMQVLDPSTGKVLVEVNPDKAFLPASVLKVVTTATAVEKLGADFRYRTGVYTNGPVEPDGTVSRDLILVGRGDSNLTDPYGELLEKPVFREFAEKLQNAGIKRIKGDIVGDDSYFSLRSSVKGWTANELKSLYGAPVNALSINNNVLWVYANPGKPKKLVSIEVEPRTSYFHVRNLGVTGSRRSKRTLRVRLIPGTRTIVVSGVLPSTRSYSQYVLLERPAEVAATLLKEELERHGIAVQGEVFTLHEGEVSSEERANWNLLAEHQSPPLIRALQIINKRSQNLHAEMLLRTLGAEFKGEGTNEAGLR